MCVCVFAGWVSEELLVSCLFSQKCFLSLLSYFWACQFHLPRKQPLAPSWAYFSRRLENPTVFLHPDPVLWPHPALQVPTFFSLQPPPPKANQPCVYLRLPTLLPLILSFRFFRSFKIVTLYLSHFHFQFYWTTTPTVLKTKPRDSCLFSAVSSTSSSFIYLDTSSSILFVLPPAHFFKWYLHAILRYELLVLITCSLLMEFQVYLFSVASKSNIQTLILLCVFFHAGFFYVYKGSHMWEHRIKDVCALHIKGIIRLIYQKLIVFHTSTKNQEASHFPAEKAGLLGGEAWGFLVSSVFALAWYLFKSACWEMGLECF